MLAQLRTHLTSWLDRQWQRQGWLSWLMMPFSLCVLFVLSVRRLFYRIFSSCVYRAPVPVVVVGNIYVGGTGKTPTVIALVESLKQTGWHPGVISRGYGIRIGKMARTGCKDIKAEEFGDEPALISAETSTPVSVHPNRKRAIQTLLKEFPDVNVIISDDGLQHLALARDVEIVVQDARGLGNGRIMPAGPLRESANRIHSVDAILTQNVIPTILPVNSQVKQITLQLEIRHLRHLKSGQTVTLSEFKKRYRHESLGAAAGIGSPEKFFNSLRHAGISLSNTLALPDHHAISSSTFDRLANPVILITAKDAIKCKGLSDERLWVVDVRSTLSDPGFAGWLDQKLKN